MRLLLKSRFKWPWVVGFALCGAGALGGVGRPILGLIFDERSMGVRAIAGVPGAAVAGAASATCGELLALAVVSPRSDYLAGVAGSDRRVVICRDPGGAGSASFLEQVPSGPDRIHLSPRGAIAALYYAGTQKLLIVTGLPGAPVVSERDLSGLGGATAVLAVSDHGVALAAVRTAGGDALTLISSDGPRPVATVGRAAAAAFLEARDEAVVADNLQDAVYLAKLTGLEMLAGERDGIQAPAAVALSGDSRETLVANDGSARIVRLSLAGGVLGSTPVACDCKLLGFERLRGNAVFRIVTSEGAPFLVYDGDFEEPRVVVVPPETEAARSGPERGWNPGTGRTR